MAYLLTTPTDNFHGRVYLRTYADVDDSVCFFIYKNCFELLLDPGNPALFPTHKPSFHFVVIVVNKPWNEHDWNVTFYSEVEAKLYQSLPVFTRKNKHGQNKIFNRTKAPSVVFKINSTTVRTKNHSKPWNKQKSKLLSNSLGSLMKSTLRGSRFAPPQRSHEWRANKAKICGTLPPKFARFCLQTRVSRGKVPQILASRKQPRGIVSVIYYSSNFGFTKTTKKYRFNYLLQLNVNKSFPPMKNSPDVNSYQSLLTEYTQKYFVT